MKTYEVVIILADHLPEDGIDKALKSFQKEIKSFKGKCSSPSRMGRKIFARPQKKMTAGEYILYNVDIDPAKIQQLLARLKLAGELFRIQFYNKSAEVATPAPAAEAAAAE